ncbi:MAG: 16S rRNA (adenine(1518)-N(6)/adenine(1519)-N(6))-dimethyltransferase RsmA [Anaerolineales bacterium]
MDTTLTPPPLHIPSLLRQYGIKPKKSLGQNFLMDDVAMQRIVKAAQIPPECDVLEIGPGLGSLTRHLALVARQVVAVELDERLLPVLRDVLAGYPNVTLVHGDILTININDILPQSGYWVVANIPYYITSAVIRRLLESPSRPNCLVLTVQQEVAQRICATAGEYNLLSLSVQIYGKPCPVIQIPPGAFYPAPKVSSTAIRIDIYPQPIIPTLYLDSFFALAKAGFSQKRKTLRNALTRGLHTTPDRISDLLNSVRIDPQRRAETLSLEEWERLTQAYYQQLEPKTLRGSIAD